MICLGSARLVSRQCFEGRQVPTVAHHGHRPSTGADPSDRTRCRPARSAGAACVTTHRPGGMALDGAGRFSIRVTCAPP